MRGVKSRLSFGNVGSGCELTVSECMRSISLRFSPSPPPPFSLFLPLSERRPFLSNESVNAVDAETERFIVRLSANEAKCWNRSTSCFVFRFSAASFSTHNRAILTGGGKTNKICHQNEKQKHSVVQLRKTKDKISQQIKCMTSSHCAVSAHSHSSLNIQRFRSHVLPRVFQTAAHCLSVHR